MMGGIFQKKWLSDLFCGGLVTIFDEFVFDWLGNVVTRSELAEGHDFG